MKNTNKSKIFFFILIGTLLTYIFIGRHFDQDINENHTYSIGQIKEIKGQSRSGFKRLLFTYHLNDEKREGEMLFLNDSLKYYESNIGNYFLVKMSDKQWVNSVFSTYKIYIDKPAPVDKIESPQKGWQEMPDWAKK